VKIKQVSDLITSRSTRSGPVWTRAIQDVEEAIAAADWPLGTGSFHLNPEPIPRQNKKPDKHPNGVKPIKIPLVDYLAKQGWMAESLPPLPPETLLTTGDLDALKLDNGLYVGFEWETGNVSSSHRAISKLLDAMFRRYIVGGFLVVPMRATQRFLTDRVGNYEELEPYFEFWRRYPVMEGMLRIYGVEHDALDSTVPHIPKGSDGYARVKQLARRSR
jgi:hypothetical protein